MEVAEIIALKSLGDGATVWWVGELICPGSGKTEETAFNAVRDHTWLCFLCGNSEACGTNI